jgi:hypothetical protein
MGRPKRKGVSQTYKDCDGFVPIFAYPGLQGLLSRPRGAKANNTPTKRHPNYCGSVWIRAQREG